MSSGFSNKPKILHGAFVEYGFSVPPLSVVFQFNPEVLNRAYSLQFQAPAEKTGNSERETLRDYHQYNDLSKIQKGQQVILDEETISFDIRLDATDDLNAGNPLTEQFGIAPQLATLELMVRPKNESLFGAAFGALLGPSGGYSFTKTPNPPMILFIWGRKRLLPVNMTSMSIQEEAFSTSLNPIRATVSVELTVIEGKNAIYKYSKAMKEAMAVLNLANTPDITDVMIPG